MGLFLMAVYCIYRPRNNLHARDAEMSKNFYSNWSRVGSTPCHQTVSMSKQKQKPLMLLFYIKANRSYMFVLGVILKTRTI